MNHSDSSIVELQTKPPAPLIANATIDRGVVCFDLDVEPIPGDVWRQLQDLAADLGSGFGVRLPIRHNWVDPESQQPRSLIVREGGDPS
jgi:hypothetical protein